MKNLTKKLSYTLYTLLAVVILASFTSCGIGDGMENDINIEKTFTIVEIDSCEYIYINRRPWSGEMALTHKGNCKYCKIRNNR